MEHLSFRNPYDSYAPEWLAEQPPSSEVGVAVRQGDARLRLQEMEAAETSVAAEEAAVAGIADRLQRIEAEHRLDMEYLLRFGVRASEREGFRRILDEVAAHGRLSLKKAANLARAQSQAGTVRIAL
ncbi:MAG: hypothetical protein KY475_26270 [Planctomycetes bacterium]|nr:hypothetical protein [Planctomycetota bacterium]